MRPLTWSRYNVWGGREAARWVLNGVSGAFERVTLAEHRVVQEVVTAGNEPGAAPGTGAVVGRLVDAGILVGAEVDEVARLERRFGHDRRGDGVLSLTIVPTRSCNFACPYCFEATRPGTLAAEVADAVVALVEASGPTLDHLDVTWFGGEPLLAAPQLLALSGRLVGACEGAGSRYTSRIVTNGWHLDGEMAAALRASGVASAQVTLDGPEPVHDAMRPHRSGRGTFGRIVANLAEASEHLAVTVRVNTTPTTVSRLGELLAALRSQGLHERVAVSVNRVMDAGASEAGPSPDLFETAAFAAVEPELADLVRRHGFETPDLPAPRRVPCAVIAPTSVVVGPQGELWKCWEQVGDDAAVVGSIFDHAAPSEGLARWHRTSPFRDPVCRACAVLPLCMGGCPHLTMTRGRDAACRTVRFNVHERVERAARRREAARGTPVELAGEDSNLQLPDPKSGVLPLELPARV